MDQRTRPAPRLAPLPPEHTPELKEQFEASRKRREMPCTVPDVLTPSTR